jgi:hypothetical protein
VTGSQANPAVPSADEPIVDSLSLCEGQELLENIIRAATDGSVKENILHLGLTKLFTDRYLTEYAAALDEAPGPYQDLFLYHRVQLNRYRGISADPRELFAQYRGFAVKWFLKRKFLAQIVDICVTQLDPLLSLVLAEQRAIFPPALPRYHALGVCRALLASGDRAGCEAFLIEYLSNADDELRLYFYEILRVIRESGSAHTLRTAGVDLLEDVSTWRDVLERFRAVYSAADDSDRERLAGILSDYVAVAESAAGDFIDIRFLPERNAALRELILHAAMARRPFALLRLVDGESYAFSDARGSLFPSSAAADDAKRERIWWSSSPSASERAAIKEQVRAAVRRADVIGIPSIYRLIRDRGHNGTAYGADESQRGLMTVIAAVAHDGLCKGRSVTEERCHHIVFDRAFVEELSLVARRLVWVTCWNEAQLGISASCEQCFIIVPPHSRVMDLVERDRFVPFYKTYPGQLAALKAIVEPGDVVLVAAGLIGKIFVSEAKARGAVALDIGAMADYFAGRVTRASVDLLRAA